jgi:hypothetical protein
MLTMNRNPCWYDAHEKKPKKRVLIGSPAGKYGEDSKLIVRIAVPFSATQPC